MHIKIGKKKKINSIQLFIKWKKNKKKNGEFTLGLGNYREFLHGSAPFVGSFASPNSPFLGPPIFSYSSSSSFIAGLEPQTNSSPADQRY